MKRTLEQSRTFFSVRNTGNRGEGRELYKTPVFLVEAVVDSLLSTRPGLRDRTWVDPCAGDGRWGTVIRSRGIRCMEYDLHPLKASIVEQDFLKATFVEPDLFFIGNPPFSFLKEFVSKSLEFADCCYFLGGSRMIVNSLGSKVELLHRFEGFEGKQKDRRSKAWFLDTNNENVIIWCAGALFGREMRNPFHISREMGVNSFAVGVHCFCEDDLRVVALKKEDIEK